MSADGHDQPEPDAEPDAAAAFREKIRSIQFLGRGKASRAKRIVSNQKTEIERAGGEFT